MKPVECNACGAAADVVRGSYAFTECGLKNVTLQGVAQSNERVSELLRNLGNNSSWFARPELVEIVAGSVTLTSREQRRVANFTIRVRLIRASEVAKVRTTSSSPVKK